MAYQKLCDKCGATLDKTHWHERVCLCDECKRQLLGEMHTSAPERDFPADWTFDDVVDKARELGYSYGNFRALVHEGIISTKGMQKAKPIRMAGRRARRRC